jgi:hypothetical protein
MQHRTASTIGYIGSVLAATLAAALISSNAWAEGPIEVLPPFVGTLTRAEVKADVLKAGLTSYASEYALQQHGAGPTASLYTRQQATADYIAARDQVRAMNAEDSGSSVIARMPVRSSVTVAADADAQR